NPLGSCSFLDFVRNEQRPDRGGRVVGPCSVRLREPVRDSAWEGAMHPDLSPSTRPRKPGYGTRGKSQKNLWQTQGTPRFRSERPTLSDHDLVLVVDFGAQYAQLIARRVREARVYSEIVPHDLPVSEMLARNPAAIILSGGPSSVYSPGAPAVDPTLFE